MLNWGFRAGACRVGNILRRIYAGGEPEELLQEAQKRLDNLSETSQEVFSFHEGFLNLVQVLDNPALASESTYSHK